MKCNLTLLDDVSQIFILLDQLWKLSKNDIWSWNFFILIMWVLIKSRSIDIWGMFILNTFWHAPGLDVCPLKPWSTLGPSSPPYIFVILSLFLVKEETCQGNLVQGPDPNAWTSWLPRFVSSCTWQYTQDKRMSPSLIGWGCRDGLMEQRLLPHLNLLSHKTLLFCHFVWGMDPLFEGVQQVWNHQDSAGTGTGSSHKEGTEGRDHAQICVRGECTDKAANKKQYST